MSFPGNFCLLLVAALAAADACALPLFAREGGEACAVCHAGSSATDKIGGFVPELSVNKADVRAVPAYVPLSELMNSRQGNYGSSVGFLNRGGGAGDLRNLTLDGFWLRGPNLRFGAQYTLGNDAAAGSEGGARKDAGTLFLYLKSTY